MGLEFSLRNITPLREELNRHPVFKAVRSLSDMRTFMEHHIYSVWDFMSLLKYLQNRLAPCRQPWAPTTSPTVRRFINDIVLEEESDLGLPDAAGKPTYASHFELYADAMEAVKADASQALRFAEYAGTFGFHAALERFPAVPIPARKFMKTTFSFIESDDPHRVAAAFALGREHIIPAMFRALLANMEIDAQEAPGFYYYLERHVHLDEDHHGPLSLLMLNELCAGDPGLLAQAEESAIEAIRARSEFWDGVERAIRETEAEPVPA